MTPRVAMLRTLVWVSLVAAGCSGSGPDGGEDAGLDAADPSVAADVPPPGTIVDSILPIEEEIRRFRATLSEAPDRLEGGAASRDELVNRFVAAVEAADTLALRDLLVTRAEFAYLYYPHTMYTRPPYELSPALLWFQIETGTNTGLSRMMEAFAGRPLEWTGYRCAPDPRTEGDNRVWADCRVLLAPREGEPAEAALFGSILERNGVFKFVSYSNEL
jgi:hypothetical protein